MLLVTGDCMQELDLKSLALQLLGKFGRHISAKLVLRDESTDWVGGSGFLMDSLVSTAQHTLGLMRS